MKTIRRPISILLAVLMVVGMFTMVPISAGATVRTEYTNELELSSGDIIHLQGDYIAFDLFSVVLKGGTYKVDGSNEVAQSDIQFGEGWDGADEATVEGDGFHHGDTTYVPVDANGYESGSWLVLDVNNDDGVITIRGMSDYYLVGTMNDWDTHDGTYELVKNPGNTDEYMLLDFAADANTRFKVVSAANWVAPTNDFTLNDAGTYDIYFRPNGGGNTADGWVDGKVFANNFRAPATYVAQIGDTKYETLAAAIDTAQTGNTITLLDDIALTGANWFVVDNKDLTIDLGGKAISSEDSVFVLKNGADLTVKNGTMTTSVSGDYAIYVNNGSVFTLNNDATLKATNSNGNGIIVRDGGKAVINGTIESGYYSIAGFGSAVVDVNAGASITSTNASALSGNGSDGNEGYTFNINGGTLTSVNDVAIYHPNQGTLNIIGGTITGATAIYVKSGTTDISTSTTSISGATITGNGAAKELVHSGNGCNPTGDAIVIENCGYPGGTPAIDISGGTIVSNNADPVHSYGYNDYEPIEKFVSGGTFSEPVPADYCANGYSPVTTADEHGMYTVEKTKAVEAYDANGDLVGAYTTIDAAIEAGGDGCTVKLVADLYEQQQINSQKTPVTLDLNGHMIDVQNGAGLNFSMGYYWNGDHIFTIKDTSEEHTGGINITPKYFGNACISDNIGRTIIVEGGTFTSTGKAIYCTGSDDGITVNGGTFNGDIYVHDTGYGHGALSITGGTVNGTLSTLDNAVLTVSGGTFSEPVPAEYCADGYDPKDNSDGTYTVAPHEHDWDYENVTWTFTENASHSIYAKYTLTCKTDPTHTKEQTGSGTLMSTVAVDGDKFVYSHSNVKIDGNSVAVPNYTRNIADGIINQYELKAAVKVAGEYKLANDITGFYDNVKPVDGFVLDGQDHMIKYGTINAGGRVMFEAADQNTKFTLKNITLDGNNRAKWAVCAYTGNSGNNAGNVITLDTVTIQNFKSNDYVGAINAFGSSTWNLKDCTITGNTTVDDSDGLSGSAVWAGSKATINIDGGTYDEVYLHSYSGTGAVLNADGGATIDNLVLDLTKTDTLKANIDDATVGAITSNEGTIPEEAVVMDPDKATVAAPEGYKWVDSDETGMKTLAQIVYVAQIGETKYESLEEAFAAAVDGDTITVLADSAGNGIKAPQGKFATNGLTVDFAGHTYTVNANTVGSTGTETQAFQLLKGNKVTFENGTIYSEVAKMLVQNYCDLTLDNMTLTLNNQSYTSPAYTLSNNNGNVVIDDTTINANNDNSFAFDVCRYASYPSVNVTVTGNSAINGDVEIFASKGQAKDGFSLNLVSGTMTGDIVLTDNAKTALANAPTKVSVKKAADFDQEAPEGYMWVDTETEGVQTIAKAVAKIGETKYATLEAAFAAAVDGDTITVLADCAGNGIKVLKNKFKTNGLTVDFDGHTYTMDGETVGSPGTETLAFQLQYNNKITFKNGTLYSEKALFLVQNYSNLTLDNMKLTLNNPNYAYGYTLSNNYGNTVIKDTTINANPAGKFAFDVCRGGGSDAYKYVHVTVTGESVINGNVEVDARNGDPKTGFSLNLESGTLNGDIKLTANAETAIDNNPDKASVNKKNTFNQDPAAGYKWKDNGDGTSTLVKADLFAGYGLTLRGDIGLIFYLDPAAMGIKADDVESVSVSFTCDKYTGTVTDFERDDDYIKVTYYVPAAYMASPVHAFSVTINDVTSNEIDDYSVQQYALRVIADPSLITVSEERQPIAVKLMKEMLNYGAKAKNVFQTQMSAPEAAVYAPIPDYTMKNVTATDIHNAIRGTATDMSTVHPEEKAEFYTPSVIYLSKTTLRMYFKVPHGSEIPSEYDGSQSDWYYWVDVVDIAANDLHRQQSFEVNGVTFNYSVLDYAEAVMKSGMDQANKDLVSALYLYNQAAIAYFSI